MKRLVFLIALFFWLTAILGGLYAVTRFEFSAGAKQAAPKVWPALTHLSFDNQCYNLVLSLHPKCSCSYATLNELEKILATSGNRLKVHALISIPPGAPAEWRQSDLVRQLQELPRTEIYYDEKGGESRLFGALTSGDTVLFSPEKKMLFHGGITESRGHIGDNAGQQAIVALAKGSALERSETPVFGCSLQGRKESRP